jgi:hypothetical protein
MSWLKKFWSTLSSYESTSKAPSGERARDAKGRYVKDDSSTPNVNEAYKDGKTPVKKVTKTTAKRGRGRPKGSKNKTK